MSLQAQTFTGITTERFKSLCGKVQEKLGIVIGDLQGEASRDGYTVSWTYIPVLQILTLQCVDKPWKIPGFLVQKEIKNLVSNA